MPGHNIEQCPKCSSKYINDVECAECGIIFEKYFKAEERKKALSENSIVRTKSYGSKSSAVYVSLFLLVILSTTFYLGWHANNHSTPVTLISPVETQKSLNINSESIKSPVIPAETAKEPEHGDEGKSGQNTGKESVAITSENNTDSGETHENLEYVYYEAKAEPNKTLMNILFKYSPIKTDGKPFLGNTKWHVKWDYQWMEDKGGFCKIIKVSTHITAKITLPKLTGSTTQGQMDKFNSYLEILKNHELGHYNNGKDAAIEIRKRILSLPEMTSCELLNNAANAVGHQVINEYNQKDAQYDRETDHGRTQGACIERF